MSLSDIELLRFAGPWVGIGFVVTSSLGFMLDVRGAIAAFGLGGIAPLLVYLPSGAEGSLVDIALGALRAPVPFAFTGLHGTGFLFELTLDWWLGGAFGAALGIHMRRRPQK